MSARRLLSCSETENPVPKDAGTFFKVCSFARCTAPDLACRGRIRYFDGKREKISFALEKKDGAPAGACALHLYIPRALGACQVEFAPSADSAPFTPEACRWGGMRDAEDLFVFPLRTFSVGLYFFRVRICCAGTDVFAGRQGADLLFFADEDKAPLLQFTVSQPDHTPDPRYLGGVIYHIFVDRFARGGSFRAHPRAVYRSDWTDAVPQLPLYRGAPLANNEMFGGTLWGIAEKLPYLYSLGVTLLCLSPVFASASNHKYDTADYMHVDEAFGAQEALSHLVEEAEKFGIGVLLDGVFNHTGSDSIYFNQLHTYEQLGAAESVNSPYFSWYHFTHFPDSYDAWWGIPILPKIFPDRHECKEYFTGEKGVIAYWTQKGIAGFRLDVADELSDSFLRAIGKTMRRYAPGAWLIGEVWEDASNKIAYGTRKTYYLGEELDSVMNYPVRRALIDYLTVADTRALRYLFYEVFANMPPSVRHRQMNLLGSHDTTRILTELGGAPLSKAPVREQASARLPSDKRAAALARLKMAYTALATLPGLPSVYYADEVGVEGYDDPLNRTPYPWDKVCEPLREHYLTVGAVRRAHRVYRTGDTLVLLISGDCLLFARTDAGGCFVSALNRSEVPLTVRFTRPVRALLPPCKRSVTHTLAPESSQIFSCGKKRPLTITLSSV